MLGLIISFIVGVIIGIWGFNAIEKHLN